MIIKFPIHIVLVDDHDDLLMILADYLSDDKRFIVHQFTSPRLALDFIKKSDVSIAVIDMHMNEMEGDQVLREIKSMRKGIETIMITGDPSVVNFHTCFRVGASDFVLKPFSEKEFLNCINQRHDHLLKWNEQFKFVKKRREKEKAA